MNSASILSVLIFFNKAQSATFPFKKNNSSMAQLASDFWNFMPN